MPVLLFRAPELEEQLFDARQDMDECVAQALHLDGLISSTSRSDDDVNLRECMDIVMKIVPSANTGAMAAMRATGADKSIEPSFKSVSKLHTRLKAAIPQLNKCEARWASLLREAAELQAIIDGVRPRGGGWMCGRASFNTPFGPGRSTVAVRLTEPRWPPHACLAALA